MVGVDKGEKEKVDIQTGAGGREAMYYSRRW